MIKQNISGSDTWTDEFENLYIVTYQQLYHHAGLIFKQEEKVKELLILTYMEAYQRRDQLQKEKVPVDWLLKREDFLAETKLEASREMLDASYAEEKMQSKEAKKENASKLDETSLLLEIEDRLNIMEDQDVTASKSVVASTIQGFFSVAVFIAAIAALCVGIWKIKAQLDVLHEPFERRFVEETDSTDAQGRENLAENNESCIQVGEKAVILSENGNVLYSLPLDESEFAGKNPENPEIQTKDSWTYYLPCPERENSQLAQVNSSLYHTLYRMKGTDEEIEVVAQEVENYTFWQDAVYVSQYNRVQRIELAEDFEKQTIGLYAVIENDEICLQDMLGRDLVTDNDGNIHYEDRIFKMQENRIEDVQPDTREKDHNSYYLKEEEGHKSIYRKVNGMEELFEQCDETVDSFCIAGDWLYYSAYVRRGGTGANYSEIHRKSLVDDGESELLGEEFKGRMRQMYYSEESNQIYGNYIPKNWKNNHGVIAVISLSGQLSYLDDEELRKPVETTGNDMLEFVMAQDGKVYCYWEDCYWKKGEEPIAIWRKVLVIPNQNRIVDEN